MRVGGVLKGHFLALLLRDPAANHRLTNVRTAGPIATTVEPALDSSSRKRGLLGRTGLAPGHALVIAPSNLVHTFFMRFPIDIVFARRDGTVVKIRRSVPARRITGALRAFAVIEMAAGALQNVDLRVGDRLELSQD